MRRCSQCGETKPLTEFNGHSSKCRPCYSTYARVYWLRTTYGLTVEQFDAMYAAQDGRCAICLKTLKKAMVDHAAGGGQVRGLLCYKCNVGIGFFDHDAETLRRAAMYLDR